MLLIRILTIRVDSILRLFWIFVKSVHHEFGLYTDFAFLVRSQSFTSFFVRYFYSHAFGHEAAGARLAVFRLTHAQSASVCQS